MSDRRAWPHDRERSGADVRLVARCRGRRVLVVVREDDQHVVLVSGERYVLVGARLTSADFPNSIDFGPTRTPIDCPFHGRHTPDGARLAAALDGWKGRTLNVDVRRVASD